MAGFEKLSDNALDRVIGGIKAYVDTGTGSNAVVRSGPGKTYSSVDSLSNGTMVRTTGENVENFEDGRTWYEIYEPIHGWIAGSLIGL